DHWSCAEGTTPRFSCWLHKRAQEIAMNKPFLAGLAAAAVVTASFAGTAEARCFRDGHHWSCGHHRAHYVSRPYPRSWAAYRAASSYAYGGSYPYYGSAYSG